MKVVFRVDASVRMGTGHIMRCLTLAKALRKRGVETSFICRAHIGSLIELLEQEAVPVTVLPSPNQPTKEIGAEDYVAWLGVSQAEDAEQSIEALNRDKPDWLVVDHYGINLEWEQRLRPYVGSLMVIDDLANGRHDCDLLLNQNYSGEGVESYKGLLPKNCRLLLGPRFSLLKPEYNIYRKIPGPRGSKDVKRVLIFFGGSDRHNMTELVLEALSTPELMHLEIDLVVGTNNLQRAELHEQVSARSLTNLYESRPHLADLMEQADIAIGAGGSTTWERMCMGLPALVVSTCENQRPISEALSEAGLIQYVGDIGAVRPDDLAQAIKELIGNRDRILELSTKSQLLVDGLGALRLAEVLNPTQADRLKMRPASPDDIALYFNWVNEPEVRRQSFNPEMISWPTHKAWFESKLAHSESYLFVLMAGDLPVGQIRFDLDGGVAQIDYSLDPLVRGRGWGSQLVEMGSELVCQYEPTRLFAEVKSENHSSRAVFMNLGFKLTESKVNGDISFYLDCD